MRIAAITILLFLSIFPAYTQNKKKAPAELIKMERGACFGACPMFKITIYTDGNAIYEGERFVDKVGKFKKQLTKKDVNNLIKQFRKADFFNFKEEYPAHSPDFPGTIISFKYKGKYRNIKHTNEVPDELLNLEQQIDKIAEAKGWQKIEETKN